MMELTSRLFIRQKRGLELPLHGVYLQLGYLTAALPQVQLIHSQVQQIQQQRQYL